jgi:hypothetical protein
VARAGDKLVNGVQNTVQTANKLGNATDVAKTTDKVAEGGKSLGKAVDAKPGTTPSTPKPGPCFAAGTLVQTPNGLVSIEDIEQGDLVLAYDFSEGRMVERKVLATLNNLTDYWVLVGMGGEAIKATRGHLFWVESTKAWVAAMNLKPGMTVRCFDGRIVPIYSVKLIELAKSEDTFNLLVEIDHDYFVGQSGTLVHNGLDKNDRDYSPEPGRDTANKSHREGFRQAKEASGIPKSQQYDTHRVVPDKQIPGKTVTEYDFTVPKKGGGTKTITIPDHKNGHPKGKVPPHFNDTGKGHHTYPAKPKC